MHPYIYSEIARDRIAELHRQAERDALAVAIRRARRARGDRPRHALPGRPARAARRVLVLLRPRSA